MRIHFIGQSKLTTFGEGRTSKKWDDDDYVTMDFQGVNGVGKKRLKVVPNIKTDMVLTGGLIGGLGALSQMNKGWKRKLAAGTVGAGLGAGLSYLGRKRMRDMDGRSDKGKKRIKRYG